MLNLDEGTNTTMNYIVKILDLGFIWAMYKISNRQEKNLKCIYSNIKIVSLRHGFWVEFIIFNVSQRYAI